MTEVHEYPTPSNLPANVTDEQSMAGSSLIPRDARSASEDSQATTGQAAADKMSENGQIDASGRNVPVSPSISSDMNISPGLLPNSQ